MSDHTKLGVFELADQVEVLVHISHLGFLHSEMIKILQPSVFNLKPKHLSTHDLGIVWDKARGADKTNVLRLAKIGLKS